MTLNELHELRDKAGIKFTKSWNCIDAEKNIHLMDKYKFFDKILERLKKMGYKPLRDFDFEVIRYKFRYAGRHHIKKTYEWKYFYSTTFEISDELIEFLTYHKFITPIDAETPKNKKVVKQDTPSLDIVLKRNERKLKKLTLQEQQFREKGQTVSADNFQRAIKKCEEKIANIKGKLKNNENQ